MMHLLSLSLLPGIYRFPEDCEAHESVLLATLSKKQDDNWHPLDDYSNYPASITQQMYINVYTHILLLTLDVVRDAIALCNICKIISKSKRPSMKMKEKHIVREKSFD
jgi:hypothetical protein